MLRLMSRAVSLYNGGFSSASCLGDSTCIISALEKNETAFNPFINARLLQNTQSQGENSDEDSPRGCLPRHLYQEYCTRRESNLMEIGFDSAWKSGPSWLKKPRFNWPCNRDFTFKELPMEETKTPRRVVMAAKVSIRLPHQ